MSGPMGPCRATGKRPDEQRRNWEMAVRSVPCVLVLLALLALVGAPTVGAEADNHETVLSAGDGGELSTNSLDAVDIYRMGANGGWRVNLTNGAGVNLDPECSRSTPVSVVFASDRRSGNLDVWLMNEDGSGAVNLTPDSDATDRNPSWSPDSARIAFESDRDGDCDIYVMDAEGGNVQQLTVNAGPWDGHPAWSPDGSQIVWARDVRAIAVMKADGSEAYDVIPWGSLGDVYHPRFSPDGAWIYFISDSGHYAIFDVWKVRLDGTDVSQVCPTGEHHDPFDLCPTDPNLMCVSIDPEGRSNLDVNHDLYLLDVGTCTYTDITGTAGPRHENHPSYSPDGTHIVFVGVGGSWLEDDDPAITYAGDWRQLSHPAASAGHLTYSSEAGASAGLTFDGTGLKWRAAMGPMAGKANVYLDGACLGRVDLYRSSPRLVALERTGMPLDSHTVTIEVSGEKNPSSSNYFVDIDAFEVVP